MFLLALADCCRQLGIDAKTLRRWLVQAQLSPHPHPCDARSSGLTADQLRLLATIHHRSLPTLQEAFLLSAPAAPAPAPFPLPAELLTLLQALSGLPAQLAAVQQQLAALTQRLAQAPLLASQSYEGKGGGRSRSSASAAARSRPTPPASRQPPQPPAHVLPLVEYGNEGHYVVLCPRAGLLAVAPDSSAWFAWLETLSSFRFVGHSGRFTAHREVERVPGAAWRAHRKIRNRTYNLHLAPTSGLTIAVLEHAAEALQAHLR